MYKNIKKTAILLFFAVFSLIASPTAFAQQAAAQSTPVEINVDTKVLDAYVGTYEDK